MNGEKLLPCPFCGGEAILEKQYRPENRADRQWEYWVECRGPETDDCQGFNGSEYAYFDEQQCAGLWNTRALTAPQSAASELLHELEYAEWIGGMYGGECPRCQGDAMDGHKTDCALAAGIAKAKGD